MNNKLIKTISVYGLVLTVCTVGFSMFVSANGFGNFKNEAKSPKYETNKHNQTYGSLAESISEETEPDLVLVECQDGTLGYVKNSDLKEKEPQNPEEAVQMQKEKDSRIMKAHEKGIKLEHKIKVYDKEGEVVIGEFTVSDESVATDTANLSENK